MFLLLDQYDLRNKRIAFAFAADSVGSDVAQTVIVVVIVIVVAGVGIGLTDATIVWRHSIVIDGRNSKNFDFAQRTGRVDICPS